MADRIKDSATIMSINDNAIAMFIDAARSANWTVETRETTPPELATSILERYPRIPNTFLDFLSTVVVAHTADGAAWFLCEPNYNGTSAYETKWNEWELFGIEYACDAKGVRLTKEFWDQHLPIVLSRRSDFAYIAIDISIEHYGEIVYGFVTSFLEPTRLYPSFPEFIVGLANAITLALAGSIDDVSPWQLTDFV